MGSTYVLEFFDLFGRGFASRKTQGFRSFKLLQVDQLEFKCCKLRVHTFDT
jgi:hypothetical protein